MSYLAIRTRIETLFFDQFGALEPNIAIAAENVPLQTGRVDPWVRLNILFADTKFMSLGQTKERYKGLVMTQIFTPLNSGVAEDERIADVVANIFRGMRVDDVLYRNSQKSSAVAGDGWLQSTVTTDFFVDL